MGPTLPLNSDHPSGDSNEEFRTSDGNGPPPLIIDIVDSSESDEDDVHFTGGYAEAIPDTLNEAVSNNIGYELLSQDPEFYAVMAVPSHEDEDEPNITLDLNSTLQNNEESFQAFTENSEASSELENRCNDSIPNGDMPKESMDPEHIEKIKNVMKSIKLPSGNLPEWSQFVPEEKWKCALMEKLHVISDSQVVSPSALIIETSAQPSSSNAIMNSGLKSEPQFSDLQLSKDSLNSPESQITDVSSSNSSSIKNSTNAPSMEELSYSPSSINQGDTVGD